MKKKIIISGVLILAIFLVGCGKTSTPEKTVSNYIEAVLVLDSSKGAAYLVEGSQGADYLPTGVAMDFAAALFPYIELGSVEVTEETQDQATVEITINGPDIESLQTNSMEQGLEIYLADPDITQEELNKKILADFTKSLDENDKVENTTTVQVVKVEDDWLLPQDSQAAILGMLIGSLGQVEIVTE